MLPVTRAASHRTGAALTALTVEVGKDIAGAKDPARVRAMAGEMRRLAAASK
jgi:hypothetical protein